MPISCKINRVVLVFTSEVEAFLEPVEAQLLRSPYGERASVKSYLR